MQRRVSVGVEGGSLSRWSRCLAGPMISFFLEHGNWVSNLVILYFWYGKTKTICASDISCLEGFSVAYLNNRSVIPFDTVCAACEGTISLHQSPGEALRHGPGQHQTNHHGGRTIGKARSVQGFQDEDDWTRSTDPGRAIRYFSPATEAPLPLASIELVPPLQGTEADLSKTACEIDGNGLV